VDRIYQSSHTVSVHLATIYNDTLDHIVTSQTILVMTTLTVLITCSLKVSDLHPTQWTHTADREESWGNEGLFLRLRHK